MCSTHANFLKRLEKGITDARKSARVSFDNLFAFWLNLMAIDATYSKACRNTFFQCICTRMILAGAAQLQFQGRGQLRVGAGGETIVFALLKRGN